MSNNVTSSISSLSSVQWTDLNGAGLSATEETSTLNLVNQITQCVTASKESLAGIWGNLPLNQKISVNDIERMFNRQWQREKWNALTSIDNGIYPTGPFAGKDTAYWMSSAQLNNPNLFNPMVGGAVFILDEANQLKWLVKLPAAQGGQIVTVDAKTSVADIRKMFGPKGENLANVVYDDANTLPQYAGWYAGLHNSTIPDLAGVSALPSDLIGLLQQNVASGITKDTKLSIADWYSLLDKLQGASFKEASKLTVTDGGGIKTYGNKWYANGQELSYLDIIFAVRVNQLFVVNSTITDNLQTVQANNNKIKAANKISAIVSSLSPANSSGTVNAQWLAINVMNEAIKQGLMAAPEAAYTDTPANVWKTMATQENTAVLFKDTTNGNKLTWLYRASGGAAITEAYDANNPLMALVGRTISGNAITTYPMSTDMKFDMTFLLSIMPSSATKLFASTTTGKSALISKNNTLSQTDCNSITTELKSYTSGVDADNQLLQTNLSQYNDKRSEILDDLSSIVKGNTGLLQSVSRNLGAG
jgi:hypothetical protein